MVRILGPGIWEIVSGDWLQTIRRVRTRHQASILRIISTPSLHVARYQDLRISWGYVNYFQRTRIYDVVFVACSMFVVHEAGYALPQGRKVVDYPRLPSRPEIFVEKEDLCVVPDRFGNRKDTK